MEAKKLVDATALKNALEINGKKISENTCKKQSHGFKTCISAVDDFGNILFERETNQTVLGGALFTILKVFGTELNWSVEDLNNIMGIANTGDTLTEEDLHNTYVCLFGAGIGGAGEVKGTTKQVKFYQRELEEMIPFRLTDQALQPSEMNKYWLRQGLDAGYTAYYLKEIQNKAVKALWQDGVDGEDGSAIPPNVYASQLDTPIECFCDLSLRIDKKDFREYFAIADSLDSARINTIGLFTGVKSKLADGSTDYKNVKLFSAFNFDNEYFQLEKGITVSYRVYVV